MSEGSLGMNESARSYLPAAGHDWSLPLYDPLVKLLGGDRVLRTLLDQAELRPGMRVVDVGCGTGTLAVMAKRRYSDVDVVGVDPDLKALARAKRKAQRTAVSIQFDRGFGDALPYPDGAFDRVFSSFMFHHVPSEQKPRMLEEIRRVLKPGGSLHMVDFDRSEHGGGNFLSRMLHSSPRLRDNAEGHVIELMRQADFQEVIKVARKEMLLGMVAFYQAQV
jgi:ubiquinone/menaquinone biosynthesis C-methylase UbiE